MGSQDHPRKQCPPPTEELSGTKGTPTPAPSARGGPREVHQPPIGWPLSPWLPGAVLPIQPPPTLQGTGPRRLDSGFRVPTHHGHHPTSFVLFADRLTGTFLGLQPCRFISHCHSLNVTSQPSSPRPGGLKGESDWSELEYQSLSFYVTGGQLTCLLHS